MVTAENRQFPMPRDEIKWLSCETLMSHKSGVSRRFGFDWFF